ncbi:hypothetical protein QUB36_28300 [Microcoleus sp. AT8-B1]|uniref:hypothetical protein n=1 Tax=unclassified Microcoleus TaxID=2642155 RepID=UPI002FD50293
MGSRTRQLEEQDRELLKFHERIGDLWLKVPDLKEQLEIERADRKDIEEEYWDKVEALTEVRSELAELQKNLATANQQLDEVTADHQQVEAQLSSLQAQLATLAADREELAQLKKEAKEAAEEVHREGRSIELEKVRWLQQLSDARAELEEAKATILKQGDKIRELERGYSLKLNPVESALRLEIAELRSQLADLEQNPAPAIDLPEPADLLNQLKGRRKKSKAELADVTAMLEILEGNL